MKGSWPRRIGWFILVYLVLVGVTLPVVLLIHPRSKLGWLLSLLLAPPIYLAAEWAGGKLFEPLGESTPLRKVAKAGCIILGYLLLFMVWVVFGPAVCSTF